LTITLVCFNFLARVFALALTAYFAGITIAYLTRAINARLTRTGANCVIADAGGVLAFTAAVTIKDRILA
jgi:hypothetical protein